MLNKLINTTAIVAISLSVAASASAFEFSVGATSSPASGPVSETSGGFDIGTATATGTTEATITPDKQWAYYCQVEGGQGFTPALDYSEDKDAGTTVFTLGSITDASKMVGRTEMAMAGFTTLYGAVVGSITGAEGDQNKAGEAIAVITHNTDSQDIHGKFPGATAILYGEDLASTSYTGSSWTPGVGTTQDFTTTPDAMGNPGEAGVWGDRNAASDAEQPEAFNVYFNQVKFTVNDTVNRLGLAGIGLKADTYVQCGGKVAQPD